jgi:flagellar protein FlaG
MALEAISGSVYHDTAKAVQKPDLRTTDVNVQLTGAGNLSVTEAQTSAKTTGGNQSQSEQDKSPKDQTASDKQIKDAISRVNKMKNQRTRCEFAYNEDIKRVSIKVVDQDTDEVIREIPPEETQKMIEKMWELAGILVDEKR